MKTIETDDMIVHYHDSDEIKNAVFNSIIAFFLSMEAFSGESIMQSDAPQLEAPSVMADIADEIIKFDIEYK